MYLPRHFEETRAEVLHEFMQQQPFGTLVTLASGGGMEANHLPFELDPHPSPWGTLRGHVARANPVWRDHSPAVEALVVFQGPSTYVSPGWYPTKRESGKVVPTWNYVVVHAYGPLRVIHDPVWLRGLVGRLTDRHEADREQPWEVSDAPADYIEAMLNAIVGIEVPLTRLLGKWKLSQNRPVSDREGVVDGLTAEKGLPGAEMAQRVRRAMRD